MAAHKHLERGSKERAWENTGLGKNTRPQRKLHTIALPAVIKINVEPEILRPVTVGSSQSLRVGQQVFAIGGCPTSCFHWAAGHLHGI